MKKIRVAHIGIKGLPARGGAERVVEAIVTRMETLNVEPTVYCDARYTSSDVNIEGVKLIRLPTVAGKFTRQTSLDLFAALHAVLLGNFDLIHLHHMEAGFILPILRLRYRVVSTSHGWRGMAKWGTVANYIMRLMDWPFMRLSNVPVFVSSIGADIVGRKFGRKALYIPNGVSTNIAPDFSSARMIQEKCGAKSGEYFLFAAGRILPEKGADLAIDAINGMHCNVPLLVVGDTANDPAYGDRLQQIAGSNVRFHPLVDDPRVLFGLVADARALIFPSLVETMSMMLLEAASLGTPVIPSDIPENKAVMLDDALYFKSGDVDSLIDQIQWGLDNGDALVQMGLRAKQRVLDEHSWDTIAGSYADLYRDVCKGKTAE